MSIYEPHLVSVPLCDTGDEILNMAESGADRRGGLTRAEPSVDLELPLSRLILDELEIKVEMLEIAAELASWTLNLDHLGLDFDLDIVGDVHGLGGQDGLHCRMGLWRSEVGRENLKP